jgi:L-ascorbate metabolism protein UlaG (beta-lactamase superfamily)
MRITWVGHSTVLVDVDGTRIVTDPVLRSRVTHLRRVRPVADADVADVDAALVSHLHFDHLDLRSLARLGRTTRVVVPRGAGPLLRRKGFTDVREVAVGDSVEIQSLTAQATYAAHGGNRPPFGPKAQAIGYLIEAGPARIYFAGDTDLFPEMGDLAPGLDVALLPIWGWGPKLGPGHLDPKGAATALALLRPRIAIPIHWGTYYPYRLGRGRPGFLTEPVDSFRRHAAELAPGVSVRVLGLGDSLDVD